MPNNLTDNLANNSPILTNSLTDNEIKKALEEWIKNYDGLYVNFKTLGNALNLINRQERENNELQLKIESYNAEIKELKCKNSNLTSDLSSLQNDLTSAKAEVERLKEEIELLHSDCTYKLVKKKAKAEAYKECIEKLKSIFGEWIFGYKTDNLLNELVGDENA